MQDTAWERLADRTGDIFEFRSPDGAVVAAELVAADRTGHGSTVALTLSFRADGGIPTQGTYEVGHPEEAPFALFVVPRSATEFDAVITWLDAP